MAAPISLVGNDYETPIALVEKDDASLSWMAKRAIDGYLCKHRGTRFVLSDSKPRKN